MPNSYKNAKVDLTTTGVTVLYTCPSATTGLVKSILVSEDTGNADTITVTITDASAAVFSLFKTKAVGANTTVELFNGAAGCAGKRNIKSHSGNWKSVACGGQLTGDKLMAIQPIVMKSRLISDNLGALPNVYNNNNYTNPDPVRRDPTIRNVTLDEDGNEKITYTIPTYERTQIDIPDDFDWSQYGKAGNALRYFNQVRTGEIEYDPSKDQVNIDDLKSETDGPPLSTEAEMIKQELISVAEMAASGVGAQVGRSVAAASVAAPDAGALANIGQGVKDFGSNFKAMDLLRAPSSGPASKVLYSPGTPNAELAKLNTKIAAGNNVDAVDAILDTKAANATRDVGKAAQKAKAALVAKGNTGFISGIKDRASSGIFGGEATAAGKANLYGGVGAGLASVAFNLISGKNLKESIKSGAKTGVGTYIGGLFGPIGALLGGILGGRVICNELMRQGI